MRPSVTAHQLLQLLSLPGGGSEVPRRQLRPVPPSSCLPSPSSAVRTYHSIEPPPLITVNLQITNKYRKLPDSCSAPFHRSDPGSPAARKVPRIFSTKPDTLCFRIVAGESLCPRATWQVTLGNFPAERWVTVLLGHGNSRLGMGQLIGDETSEIRF